MNWMERGIEEADAAVERAFTAAEKRDREREERQRIAEAEWEAAEGYTMTDEDRAEMNRLIDEERERDQAADEAYWQRMAELEDERRQDR